MQHLGEIENSTRRNLWSLFSIKKIIKQNVNNVIELFSQVVFFVIFKKIGQKNRPGLKATSSVINRNKKGGGGNKYLLIDFRKRERERT